VVTGWGVIEKNGTRVRAVAAGVVRGGEAPLEARLVAIHRGLADVVREHAPSVCAVEDVFYAKNARAALTLGHARGVALLAAAEAGLLVHAYPPAVVKRSIAGRGGADKKQVAKIVGMILGMKELPPADATDALALAITHAHAAPTIEAFSAASAKAGGGRGAGRARRRRSSR
jgi:crossover junction endodeoxyribonuclease RuvC